MPDDATHGTLRLRVTNTVGPGEPPYIAGADPEVVGGYGVYPGRLAVSFPAGTELARGRRARAAEVAGADGGTEVLAAPVRIAPGETVVWEVDYVLGQALDGLRILPSARSPGIEWHVGDRVLERRAGARPHRRSAAERSATEGGEDHHTGCTVRNGIDRTERDRYRHDAGRT